ncbi:hypothetical protein TNIN_311961 [Trichonephila inaurata madagascariensis]|uniref:Uncharacterized protein n=1 Tax=Trichonephila inaurata madagascariensis TaxID=2747483 RepID=A0A8X6MA30_9ARAC|nr:hypothetical protein TNIN_311961 [Trichonephila inaurata madagascariensis]
MHSHSNEQDRKEFVNLSLIRKRHGRPPLIPQEQPQLVPLPPFILVCPKSTGPSSQLISQGVPSVVNPKTAGRSRD